MKTLLTKGLAILGIGAMMFGVAAVSPALADGRSDDNCARPAVQIRFNDRFVGYDNDRKDRDDHRGDSNRFDRRDDRK